MEIYFCFQPAKEASSDYDFFMFIQVGLSPIVPMFRFQFHSGSVMRQRSINI